MRTRADGLPTKSRHRGRIAARIAARTARRHPGRSALIVALVALPTAGLAGAGVVVTSSVPTTDERLTYTLGQTEALVSVVSPPDPTLDQAPTEAWSYMRDTDANGMATGFDENDPFLDPADVLPRGTRLLTITESAATVRTEAGIAGVTIVEGDAGDPALDGRYHLAEGREPRGRDEVAVNRSAVERLGVGLGGTLHVTEPRDRELMVVGIIEDLARYDSSVVVFARTGTITANAPDPSISSYYVADLPLDWDAVRELNRSGMVVYSREVVEHPRAPADYTVGKDRPWTESPELGTIVSFLPLFLMFGSFALFQVCLLAGAAFVVGMRADQRALATIASVGGEPGLIARIVSAGGIVLGAIGGLLGVALGMGGGWVFLRISDDGNATTLPGFHPNVFVLTTVLLVATLAGWIAALSAAVGARRIDVVQALRGARRPRPARPRRAVAGAVIALAGFAGLAVGGLLAVLSYWPAYNNDLAVVAITVLVIGAIATQLGLVLATPALLALLARPFSRVGEGARLASRDASRNHSRSVPAVAAVMSTVFVASFAMTFVSSNQVATDAGYLYSAPRGTLIANIAPRDEDGPHPATEDQVHTTVDALGGIYDPQEITVIEGVPDPEVWPDGDGSEREFVFPYARLDPDCGSPALPFSNAVTPCPNYLTGTGDAHLLVGDSDDLAALLGHRPTDAAVRMLEQGGAVALYPQYVSDDELTIDTWSAQQVAMSTYLPDQRSTPLSQVEVPAMYEDPGFQLTVGVVLAPATADRLGIDYGPIRVLARLDAAPSDQQSQAMNLALQTLAPGAWSYYENGPGAYGATFAWALLGLTAIIAFGAASIAIGLARADARRDDEVLDAIGAPPSLRRSVAFWQAIVISGIGSLLGAAIGLLPVLALAVATWVAHATGAPVTSGPLTEFAPPWLQLALVAGGVPLVIAAGSWATSGRRRVAVRRVA
ncbi:hypothetical protein [Homoserinibacter sp. GY 40078]|uniref:hypothetical protein n=1 Tax=Homoserinibacter sp. GY 40078 TaxID=2603275 RepID=UPI0011CC0582|nr:hypothetical protein [Homoserinibacter sp. GY 40078]TXK18710.1 hypothetical protein FVQ89_01850 [Homoserinibacter sp. GY 40078]